MGFDVKPVSRGMCEAILYTRRASLAPERGPCVPILSRATAVLSENDAQSHKTGSA